MPDNITEISENINLVLGCIVLKKDYKEKLHARSPFVLVEGATDLKFFGKIKKDTVELISVSTILNDVSRLRRTSPVSNKSCKKVICDTIYGLSVIPSKIKCQQGATDWLLYGVVDRDFEDFENITITQRLLQTDTHDLETLMLSTDEEALQNISEVSFSSDEISKAECLAYEMSKLRQQIRNNSNLRVSKFTGESGVVEYSEFVDGTDIDAKKAVSYLTDRDDKKLSKNEKNMLVSAIISENRRNIDSNGKFTYGSAYFDPLFYPDFWYDVNGHDLLSALIYVNEDAFYKYYDAKNNGLNRKFEFDLINAYNVKRITRSTIYRQMHSCDLVEVY